MQMPLLSLKNGRWPLLFESEDLGEVWKLFSRLQNKLPKALLFNEANHERFELTQYIVVEVFVILPRMLYFFSVVNICIELSLYAVAVRFLDYRFFLL